MLQSVTGDNILEEDIATTTVVIECFNEPQSASSRPARYSSALNHVMHSQTAYEKDAANFAQLWEHNACELFHWMLRFQLLTAGRCCEVETNLHGRSYC